MIADASPHHEGPAVIAVVLHDGGVLMPFSSAPPHPVPLVMEGEGKPVLICEELLGPLGPRPPYVHAARCEAPPAVDGSQEDSDRRAL